MEKLHVGVVVNPSKLKDVAEFRGRVVSHVFNVDPDAQVSFYETTVEDAGFGQAQQAVSDGCSAVAEALSFAFFSGVKSTPASLRCCGVMGAGAAVSGS